MTGENQGYGATTPQAASTTKADLSSEMQDLLERAIINIKLAEMWSKEAQTKLGAIQPLKKKVTEAFIRLGEIERELHEIAKSLDREEK